MLELVAKPMVMKSIIALSTQLLQAENGIIWKRVDENVKIWYPID